MSQLVSSASAYSRRHSDGLFQLVYLFIGYLFIDYLFIEEFLDCVRISSALRVVY